MSNQDNRKVNNDNKVSLGYFTFLILSQNAQTFSLTHPQIQMKSKLNWSQKMTGSVIVN